jgi:BRCA1-associated protein
MSSAISTAPRVTRKRVSFGNPALGTYKGTVYTTATLEYGDTPRDVSCRSITPLIEGVEAVNKMVAMVNVPPEHVPESLLNLMRSHRPFIEHVRVVIAETDDGIPNTPGIAEMEHDTAANLDKQEQESSHIPISSPAKFPMGGAAPDLASDSLGDTFLADSDKKDQKRGRTYLVLFQMASEEDAGTFVEDLNGKPYIAFDDQDLCSVEHVVALEGEDGVSLLNPHFAPSMAVVNSIAAEVAGATPAKAQSIQPSQSSPSSAMNKAGNVMDDQNCAVCLERLVLNPDDHATVKAALLTTVCNHTFHLDCLRQWSGPCIVCRFDHSGLNETLSQCHLCGTTEHNYVCLICGCISCVGASGPEGGIATSPPGGGATGTTACNPGVQFPSTTNDLDTESPASSLARRFHTTHAGQHYTETLHAYALDTQNQHVYDFAGQGYVHRLVQNKEDGKLVEINDPYSSSQERSMTPGLSDAQEGEVVHRKLEGFASQYYTLLKSQLEQQRTFYEGRLQELRREFATKERNNENSKVELLAVLRQERKQLAQRLLSIQRRTEKTLDDAQFLRNMNESLEANKPGLEQRILEAQREQIASREMIQKYVPALEEKVTTLMLQLEGSSLEK